MSMARLLVLLALLFKVVNAMAGNASDNSFTADATVQQVAESYAKDAVNFSSKQFGIELDWSDNSVANVEKALDKLSISYTNENPKPTEAQVMSFAKAFGSYIGEVYRRNHGATWGISSLGGQQMVGLSTRDGVQFWPWARAFKRITLGAEDNVSHYYSTLLEGGVK